MTCAACRSDNLPSARYCATCGVALAHEAQAARGLARRPAPFVPAPRPMVAEMLFVCPHCGQTMRPMAYFSRGVNVAKALLLMFPLNVLGPLIFFFLRRDRLICGFCKRLVGSEVALPMRHGYAPGSRLAPLAPAGALATYDPEDDSALLERRSRRYRARAWTWGAVTAGLAGLGALVGIGSDANATMAFLMMATPAGVGALVAAFRSRALGRRAAAMRGREQRARVLDLARASGGRLNVSLVATELRIELSDAEQLLGSMVDGQRVEMEVDDAGRISYLFTELVG
jgi:hypothetical protein